ncbi:MAG: iron ABC transporter permease [Streptococcus minor]|nr:iron ABC transporter permease [Streptococcus minor]
MMKKKHFLGIFSFLIILLLVGGTLSLSTGYSHSSFLDILDMVAGRSNQSTLFIVSQIRLPRILATVVGGASLALAGFLLQTLTRNPLADSGILGINTGAGLAVAILVGLSNHIHPTLLAFMPLFAMLGGALTTLIVYLIAKKKHYGIHPTRLIITGVGISSMLAGIMVSIISRLNDFKMEYIVQWLSGRVNGGDWTTLAIYAPLLVLIWVLSFSRSRALNIMNLNDQTAMALGLQLQKERMIVLMLATALAALSVVLVGNITFVGLIAGHITRHWLGNDHRISLPASMLIGSSLLLLADTIGRVLLVGTGIPTGIIVSLIGAPYFLYLLKQTEPS